MRWRGTLRSRVVLAFAVGGLLVPATFAVATYALARDYLLDQRYRTLLRQAYADSAFLQVQLATVGTSTQEALEMLSPVGSTTVLVHRHGRWASSSLEVGPDAVPPTLRRQAEAGAVAYQPIRSGDLPAVVVAVPIPAAGAVVYELTPLDQLQGTMDVLSRVLAAGALVAALLAAGLGLWARRRVLRPLDPVAATAAAIAGGDLDRRLPPTDDPDLVTIVGSLNRMVDALQQRIERDARFAADVSHELRSPLTTLVASVGLLNDRSHELSPRSRRLLELVTSELDRLEHLLSDLLELARIDARAEGSLAGRPVDLVTLAREALRSSGHDPEESLTPFAERAVVSADKLRLERAVTNLLDNAARHGGGLLGVQVHREGDDVLLLVDDAGCGVPRKDRERVFERFATAGGARGSGKGTGLGLALVRETATAHGGSVWCTDRPGGGARFVLRIPALAPDRPTA